MKQEFTTDEIKLLYKALIYLKDDLYHDMLEFILDGKLNTEEAKRVSKRLQEAKALQIKLAREISDAEMAARCEAFKGSDHRD